MVTNLGQEGSAALEAQGADPAGSIHAALEEGLFGQEVSPLAKSEVIMSHDGVSQQDAVAYIRKKVEALLIEAECLGVVIRVETKPLEPLAMGNHKMVADVQPKHPY